MYLRTLILLQTVSCDIKLAIARYVSLQRKSGVSFLFDIFFIDITYQIYPGITREIHGFVQETILERPRLLL